MEAYLVSSTSSRRRQIRGIQDQGRGDDRQAWRALHLTKGGSHKSEGGPMEARARRHHRIPGHGAINAWYQLARISADDCPRKESPASGPDVHAGGRFFFF